METASAAPKPPAEAVSLTTHRGRKRDGIKNSARALELTDVSEDTMVTAIMNGAVTDNGPSIA